MLLRKLIILSIIIYLGGYFAWASYGKSDDMNSAMQRIADSLRIFEKEERLNYVRYSWRIAGYFFLIVGIIFFIIVLITGGETIHIKIG